jgi:hypothetical protein
MTEPIEPSRETIRQIDEQYPNEADAQKYRLAQAQTLIDWFHANAVKGGKARMKKLGKKDRVSLAKKASKARWAKARKGK